MRRYIDQMPTTKRPIQAGEHTLWSRPYAKTLPERTDEHQATPVSGNRPVGIGQGWSTLAWIPPVDGSWALPWPHQRLTSWESPISKAVWQLRQVCRGLNIRALSLWDSELGSCPIRSSQC
jgi:hypothetical protein